MTSKKVKNIIFGIIRIGLGFLAGTGIGIFILVNFMGYELNIGYVQPPQNPLFPTNEMIGTYQFDNDTKAEMDENVCKLTYTDGTVLEIPRATNKEIKLLNEHLEEAELRWINLHIGTCLIVYTFTEGDTQYEFYQHMVDTDYVFLNKTKVSMVETDVETEQETTEQNENGGS